MEILQDKKEEYERYKDVNSKSPYSMAVVSFGERWADLIEQAMAGGAELEAVASELSHKANTEDITGYMYGAAAQALSHFWVLGERFRQWYNVDTGGEQGKKANETPGATLNPAIIEVNLA